jgi:ATP-dependent helicase/nuclease subunit B
MHDSHRVAVVPAPPNVRRQFFSWDSPLLPQIVTWLAADWDGTGALDLSRLLAVVPTRQAGRRLREALAVHSAAAGRAVFPPRVITPDALVASAIESNPAGRLSSILAWSAVLVGLDLENFREVFPVDPPARNFSWSLRLAQQLLSLQAALAESGWRIADVPRLVRQNGDESFPETERWRQLAELEGQYDAELSAAGLCDAQAAKIGAAEAPSIPKGVERIVVLATPDPWPIAVAGLAALARHFPVDVAIFAPAAESGAFDEWGRPIVPIWSARPLELPAFAQHVHLNSDPAAQAEMISGWALDYRDPVGILAIGAADSETVRPLEMALDRAGFAVFNPEGRPRRDGELYLLLAALADLATDPTFTAIEALGRCPDFIAFARVRCGSSFSPARWLGGWDELRTRHLPGDLAAAQEQAPRMSGYPEVTMVLSLMTDLRSIMSTGSFSAGAAAVLAELFSARRLYLDQESDRAWEESAAAWMAVLRECVAAEEAGLARADWWDLALRLFGDTRRTEEKAVGAMELQGWLELLWEDAPHLAIAGFNDGRVPEAVAGDPFLPDSLRRRLNLKTNDARLARDAYLLQALAQSRAATGRLDLLFGKVSAAGDPLRPSRLLFQCPDEQLAARVTRLFRPVDAPKTHFAWTRAWRLTPPSIGPQTVAGSTGERRVAAPTRVGVTALRAWLACPFRFYLRHVLEMESVDPAKNEMDPADFGTLCHAALEAMGREPALCDCCEPEPLREFLLGELDRQARRRFGPELPLPLVIQLDSARQRLRRVAEIQAAERAAGWRIEFVERKIQVTIAGLEVIAKIDRIDRHVKTGAVRVLDYKTADTPVNPASAHLRPQRVGETARDWAVFDLGSKSWVWSDLQLPLYRRALAAEFPDIAACGYFNLPKAIGDSGLSWWEPYPEELQMAALVCAEGVCGAIRAGDFWPPNEQIRSEFDPFAALFHRGVAPSIAWKGAS